jgi:hypothetical protein
MYKLYIITLYITTIYVYMYENSTMKSTKILKRWGAEEGAKKES